jgi:hypothetical protein
MVNYVGGRAEFVVIVVEGACGVGKTSLLRSTAVELEAGGIS